MDIPSTARSGKHFVTLDFDHQGMKDRRELHFFVKNPGGWEKDPDADALRKQFPGATVAVLQQGLPADGLEAAAYAGCADASILSTHEVPDRNSDGVNFGGTENLEVGHYGVVRRSLVRFDLSRIPKDARVEAAWLKMYAFQGSGTRTGGLGYPQHKLAYRVLRPWGSGTGNGDLFDRKRGQIREGECSWKEARQPEAWGAPGCDKAGVDREARPISMSRCDAQPQGARGALQPVKKVWVKWDLTAAAKDWVAAPVTNFGVLLATTDHKLADAYGDEGTGRTACEFRSSEYYDPPFRPKLVLVFRKPGE